MRSVVADLQASDRDADATFVATHPWLTTYQKAGRKALAGYLGTPAEVDFAEISRILAAFHDGAGSLMLKRMGRTPDALWYDEVDVTDTQVIVVEWTHGNNDYLTGVDIPILLNSTPEETLAHRRARSRDGAVEEYYDLLDQGRLPVVRGLAVTRDDLVRRAVIMSLMCQGEVQFESIELAHLVDFNSYFASELTALRELETQGLVSVGDRDVQVTADGWFFVRAIAMVFDRYLQADRTRAKFSKII